jgi:hypothetical protein
MAVRHYKSPHPTRTWMQAERVEDLGVGVTLQDATAVLQTTAAAALAHKAMPAAADEALSKINRTNLQSLLPPLLHAVRHPSVRVACAALSQQLQQEGNGLLTGVAAVQDLLSRTVPQALPVWMSQEPQHQKSSRVSKQLVHTSKFHAEAPYQQGEKGQGLAQSSPGPEESNKWQRQQQQPGEAEDAVIPNVATNVLNSTEASVGTDHDCILLAPGLCVATGCEKEARFIFNEIFVARVYSHPEGTGSPPTVLDPRGVILDAGANIGLFALSVLLNDSSTLGDSCSTYSSILPAASHMTQSVAAVASSLADTNKVSDKLQTDVPYRNHPQTDRNSDGEQSRAGARMAPYMYAIEPLPPNVQLLRFNLNAHEVGESTGKVTVVPEALGASDGVSTFTYYPGCPGNSTVLSGCCTLPPTPLPFLPIRV